MKEEPQIVHLSSSNFFIYCIIAAFLIVGAGIFYPLPAWIIAVEIIATVFALFIFGSIRYRLDKNALSYGMALVITASFISLAKHEPIIPSYYLTFHGLDELIHLDTILFIFSLTFFVAVIAQTRMLEAISFKILTQKNGNVVATLIFLTAVVSVASGVLDGVSMIGLMIRTMVAILFLAKVKDEDIIYAIMVSTIITTVCGMWLAYGEPPNLIMKANLHPHLNDAFFLRYCLPAALGSYFIVAWNIKRKLFGKKVEMKKLTNLDKSATDIKVQMLAALGFIPFIVLLIMHSRNHNIPLFLSAFCGFLTSWLAVAFAPKLRRAALHEAFAECKEYFFLIPLFFAITLLQKTGFFANITYLLHQGLEIMGQSHIAFVQFVTTILLSAILDNNIVADFAAKSLQQLEVSQIHLFSLAQIAGYALGGCLTHIGSAQSVVAYAFIIKYVDKKFTPFQWIKNMAGIIFEIFIFIAILIYLESWLLS